MYYCVFPDYDTTFTFSVVKDGVTVFDDKNELSLEQRKAIKMFVETLDED